MTEKPIESIPAAADEATVKALVERLPVGVVLCNAAGKLVAVSDKFCEMTAFTREELLAKSVSDLTHPDTSGENFKLFQKNPADSALFGINSDSAGWTLIGKDGGLIRTELETEMLPGGRWLLAVVRDISSRKRDDKASAHPAAIIESSSDAIISTDLAGAITSWNKGAERIFGYAAEEALKKNASMLIPPLLSDEESEITARIRRGETVEHYETRRQCRDGHEIEISLSVSPIRDEHGAVIGISQIARDITERSEVQEALRESQAILSLSMRNSRMGAWVQDVKTDYVWWSDELLEIFGLKKGDFSNNRKGFYDFVHPDDHERIYKEVRQALNEHRDYVIEFRFLRADDGSTRWMEGRGQAFYTKDGEVTRLYGVGIDVTERKQNQEQLIAVQRRAAEDYQALLSRIVTLAQALGTSRDLTSVYRTVCEFANTSMPCSAFFVSFYDAENSLRLAAYAWSGEEGEIDISCLPPMPLSENGGPNSQAVFQKRTVIVNNFMESMKNRPHVVLHDNGAEPLSSLVVPMIVMNRIIGTLEVQAYENGAFTREHVVALEMVANLAAVAIENVRLLKVEEQARREAETANRAKDEFLSVLSHELRTPLNSIFGWTRMLHAGILDQEKTRQAIDVIDRNVRLQNSLIEDMLDVSRIITGKMRLEKAETDFAALVRLAVEAARPQAEQKKISLVFNADADSYVLLGDEVRLQQVVSNLINNAVKFTPEEGAVILSLSTLANGGSVLLNVTDTGIGIEPDFLPQIFDRFRQADSTTKRTHSGLGLGLTIVRHLTELHGGRVRAESGGIGKGASFIIELPLLPLKSNDFAANRTINRNANGALPLKGSRILLVDDDCDAMMPLQIILEEQQAEVTCASSVREALEKLSQDEFNLLVSDIGMPEMDGYDLITALRKMDSSSNHDIPAIALTAYASTRDKRRALMSGFQHHFAKPLEFEPFLAAVGALLANSEK